MKRKSLRVARRREQRRARREERLRQQALLESLGSTEWDEEGLEATPTEQIVVTLAKLGIQTDEARFRELALACDSVDGAAAAWLANAAVPGLWEDYPWLAARALWPRWVPDLFSIDVFIEQHLAAVPFHEVEPETLEDAQREWRAARAVMDLVAPHGGPARPDLLDQLTDHSALDVKFWLGNLPFSLARLGMVDEAVEICSRLAPVYETAIFLRDRAKILARAGRREEALRQVEENLDRFPDDLWVHINAGDVYRDLGEMAMAETAYRQALDTTDENDIDGDVAKERLAALLRETGRGTDAAALLDETGDGDDQGGAVRAPEHMQEAGDSEPEHAVPTENEASDLFEAGVASPVAASATRRYTGPKVGRNAPCPCGSGQKFKRCCGR